MWIFIFLSNFFFFNFTNCISTITVVYEDQDSLAIPFLNHLNVSFMFYHSQYSSDTLVFDAHPLQNGSSLSNSIVELQEANFIISLARSPDTIQTVREISQQTGIATIQLQMQPWDLSYATTNPITNFNEYFMLIPSYVVFDNIIPELTSEMNITNDLTVLYDYDLPDPFWQQPFKKLPINVYFEPMRSDPESIQQHVATLKKNSKFLLLAAKTESIENYVLQAGSSIEDSTWVWIAYSKDTKAFKCDDCLSARIFWVRIMSTGKVENIRVLEEFILAQELDKDLNYSVNTWNEIQISTCLDMMQMAFNYLIKTNGTIHQTSGATLIDDSNFTLIDEISRNDVNYEYGNYNRHSSNVYYQDMTARVFKIDRMADAPDAYLNKYIGNWTLASNLTSVYDSLGVDVRSLNHYRIVTIIQPPFIEMDPDPNTGKLTLQGYCIDLLALIQQQLGFTYDLYLTPDGQFGSMDVNGNWNGLIGELVTGSAEIAMGPIAVMAERENDIDFTVPYYDLVGITILMKKTDVEYSLFKFMQVLEWPVCSLDDLAKQYKIEYAPLKGGATETYFRRMAEIEEKFYSIWKSMSLNESMKPQDRAKLAVWDYPVSDKFTNMWRYMQEVGSPLNTHDAVERVLTSENGFAFIGDAMDIQYAILTNCRLQSVGSEFSRKPYAIAIQTGHPLKTPISTAILQLLNQRKLETLKEKWWNQNPNKQNCPTVDDESNGISIQNIGGVFIVILAGIVVSLVILMFEYFYYKHKKEREEAQAQAQARANGQVKVEETNLNKSAEDNKIVPSIHNGNSYHYKNEAFQY